MWKLLRGICTVHARASMKEKTRGDEGQRRTVEAQLPGGPSPPPVDGATLPKR
jgi:hypothetical protein